jgi:uncharacterized protein YbbK (DUF523 family)
VIVLILVSACLVGVDCKYNGGNNNNSKVLEYIKDKKYILVCPEQLGGLPTPRTPSEIVHGEGKDVINKKAIVMNKEGNDVSLNFIKGAYETLKIAKLYSCREAILKAKSPSCGNKQIYDGNFKGSLKNGMGVTATILTKEGIKVVNENEI